LWKSQKEKSEGKEEEILFEEIITGNLPKSEMKWISKLNKVNKLIRKD
jgi:hypothetical protein